MQLGYPELQCHASEFLDEDPADSKDVAVVYGVTFINEVAVSDINHDKKKGGESLSSSNARAFALFLSREDSDLRCLS